MKNIIAKATDSQYQERCTRYNVTIRRRRSIRWGPLDVLVLLDA